MKINKILIFVVLVLLLPAISPAVSDQNTESATEQINKFLVSEFNGDGCARDDSGLVKYDHKTAKAFSKNIGGACVYLNASSLIVVSAYEILSVKLAGKSGKAKVVFRTVARTEGWGEERHFVPNLIKKDVVEYLLTKYRGKWLIYNPPYMRISKRSIVDWYDQDVQFNNKIMNDPGISDAQRKNFLIDRTALDDLKQVPE